MYVVSRTHYSMMVMFLLFPRVPCFFYAESRRTSVKGRWLRHLLGHSGSYEVTGDTLILRPVVATVPNLMAGGVQRFQLRQQRRHVVADGSL